MWILLAFGSAYFAGMVSILVKIGLKNTDANLATALRTVVVVIFAWMMVFIVGSYTGLPDIDRRSLVFLVLSGLCTGASWLCYFRALKLGDVNKVVPIDKSSVVLTMLMAFTFLREPLSLGGIIAIPLIGFGTFLMIERKEIVGDGKGGGSWFLYAILAAVFASLQAILGSVGIAGIESNLGVAIRTIVVLIMAWVIVLMQGKQREIKTVDKRSWVFLCLSGVATGIAWLLFYRALQLGPASVVVPIDKLSIVVTIAFGCVVFGERMKKKAVVGLVMIVAGTLGLLI